MSTRADANAQVVRETAIRRRICTIRGSMRGPSVGRHRYDTFFVFFLRKSIRMNCPSVIVFVK